MLREELSRNTLCNLPKQICVSIIKEYAMGKFFMRMNVVSIISDDLSNILG